MPADILFLTIARALVEVAGMLLLGQGVLWLFGPKAREGNFVYDLFAMARASHSQTRTMKVTKPMWES